MLRSKADNFGDFLTDSVPTLLAASGEGAIEKLEEFVRDEGLDTFARNSVATALTILGHQLPARSGEVLSRFLQLIRNTADAELAAF